MSLTILTKHNHLVCGHYCVKKDRLGSADLKNKSRDFPGGTVVGNPPANAGGTGSIPGLGRFPRAAEQLSPCATTTEPAL